MKRIIITIAISLIQICGFAQIPDASKSLLSPNAAALGEYGEVPVSLFTGVPQIEIPIYTLQYGPHTLPISVSYHSGGVRPDQYPGWVGLGWSLNAGGCISRVVKDLPDEYDNSESNISYKRQAGYYFKYGYLQDNPENPWDKYLENYQLEKNIIDVDTEPDEFCFNFLDYHGKFFLDVDGSWKIQCDKAIDVELLGKDMDPFDIDSGIRYDNTFTGTNNNEITYSKTISGFRVISEDGTKYIFGEDCSAIEFSIDFFNQNIDNVNAVSWYLKRIEYTDGRKIYFNYYVPFSGDGGKSIFTAQLGISNRTNTRITTYNDNGTDISKTFNVDTTRLIQGMIIRSIYLNSIVAGNDSLMFGCSFAHDLRHNMNRVCKSYYQKHWTSQLDYFCPLLYFNSNDDDGKGEFGRPDAEAKQFRYSAIRGVKLDYIDICKRNTKAAIKQWIFTYNDSIDGSAGAMESIHERLMLNQILEKSGKDATGKKYSFEYYGATKLPDYLSGMTDHWGFYNRRQFSYNTFNSLNLSNFWNLKQPAMNDSCVYYGTLSKITYPTGGYTKFFYEPHDYSKKVGTKRDSIIHLSSDEIAGGLRIKRIESYTSANASPIVKQYDYKYDLGVTKRSSGFLATNHKYYFEGYQPKNLVQNGNFVTINSFSTQSVIPGSENACGSHIGYSVVTELNSDGSSVVHTFTNYNDIDYNDDIPEGIVQKNHAECEPFSSKSFKRGLPISELHYDSAKQIIFKKEYEYESDKSNSNDFVYGIKYNLYGEDYSNGPAYNPLFYILEGASYKCFTCLMRKKSERITIYDYKNSASADSMTHFTNYEYNANKLISKMDKGLNGSIFESSVMSYVSDSTNSYPSFSQKHILSPMLSNVVSRNNTLTQRTQNIYQDTVPLPTSILKAKGDNEYYLQSAYHYDTFHNPIEEISEDGKQTVYLWGYNAQYIIATIENASLQDVMSALGEESISSLSLMENLPTPNYDMIESLRSSLINAAITTYQYEPLVGVKSVTFPNGIKNYYEYDEMGRLQVVKDNQGNLLKVYNYHYKN